MQQSNVYIIVFSAILTIVLGGLLSLTSVLLGPKQKQQEKLDTQKKILGAVMDLNPDDDVVSLYEENVESLVVNAQGDIVEGKVAEKINIGAEFKKPVKDRLLPVFKFIQKDQVEAYIFPVYGNGLWDNIWGYLALEKDLNTIKGVVFDHKAETPGLGARITESSIQNRYVGKELFNDNGNFVSVTMRKGEVGDPKKFGEHEVDGMSGATLTANGVNDMIANYIGNYYSPYFEKISSKQVALIN